MVKELLIKWAEALESGKYQICVGMSKGILYENKVDAIIVGFRTIITEKSPVDWMEIEQYDYFTCFSFKKLGIPSDLLLMVFNMNHTYNKSFSEIAEYLKMEAAKLWSTL